MKTNLLYLFLLLFLFSCNDKEEDAEPSLAVQTAKKDILGQWEMHTHTTTYYDQAGKALKSYGMSWTKTSPYIFSENTVNYYVGAMQQSFDWPYTITSSSGKLMLTIQSSGIHFAGDTFQIESIKDGEMVWLNEKSNVQYSDGGKLHPADKLIHKIDLRR